MASSVEMAMDESEAYDNGRDAGAGMSCENMGTFIVSCLVAIIVMVAVIGFTIHATRYTDVYHWQTLSDVNPPQAQFTIDWYLRAEGDHRYLVLKSDTQLLDAPLILNSDAAFPAKHLPLNMWPGSLGTVHEVNTIAYDSLDIGKSASLLIIPTGQTLLMSRMVQQDIIVGPPNYGGLLDLFIAGFAASPLLTVPTAFGGNVIHYMTRVSA